jgi:outer membrane protein OmpA-like peptidoglycan-associated protein
LLPEKPHPQIHYTIRRSSMRRFLSLALLACCGAATAHAQADTQDPSAFVPRYSVALGYNNIRANAPPDDCGCFDMNGGFVSASVPIRYWLSAAAEVTGGRASRIGPLGQDLNLTTFTAGPQVTWRGSRFVPFAQALFGAAHGGDSFFPTASGYSDGATSFAFTAGGGLDVHLNHRFAVRAIEAQFLHTGFPNAANNGQRQLMLGAGIVFKFRGHYAHPVTERPRPQSVADPAPSAAALSTPSVTTADVPTLTKATSGPISETDFHRHIHDIFFDYDSASLKPEAQQSIEGAVTFLDQHPDVHLAIAGYADERGTVEYNFNLGKRRAEATARALLAAGVPESRIRVVSYGKTVEVCLETDEACWQRNRRAAFTPAP